MYKGYTEFGSPSHQSTQNVDIVETNGQSTVNVDSHALIRDAQMHKDGMDLVLETQDGQTVIKDYYAGETAPDIISADGTVLTPQLVNSFTTSSPQFANAGSMSDESPVGAVQELNGSVYDYPC